jgi:hypothetical protein
MYSVLSRSTIIRHEKTFNLGRELEFQIAFKEASFGKCGIDLEFQIAFDGAPFGKCI